MLFYDWKKMFEAAEGSPLALFIIFKMLATDAVPRNKYDDIYKYAGKHFYGESFLIHPDVLLHSCHKHEYREIAQYLAVASMRPYADYLTTGETTLDLLQCEIEQEYFEDNSLLRIEDGKVHFLYEEVTQENLH
mgnify:CR=1 FL=1|jgi:hypothetical protein